MKQKIIDNIVPIVIGLLVISYFFVPMLSLFAEMFPNFQETIGQVTSTDYARITDVEYKAVLVDEENKNNESQNNTYYEYDYYDEYDEYDGYDRYDKTEQRGTKIIVTEKITFDVRAASKNNPFWELWLGLGEEEIDGLRRTYKVNSVKQILPDGSKITWEESPKLYWDDDDYVSSELGPNKWYHSEGPYNESQRRYECLMFYVDGIYREKITFEVEYEIYNSVLKYEDCSELYIPMYSGDTSKYLNSFKGEILIPNKDMPRYPNYEATGFGTKKGSFKLEESKTKNEGYTTFSFDLNEKDLKFLKGYEYLEFDMYSKGIDKHIFADYAENNTYSNYTALDEVIENRDYYLEAPDRYEAKVITLNIIVLSVGVVLLVLGFLKISKMRTKTSLSDGENIDDYSFRNIPSNMDPKFAAELVFIKDIKPPKNNEDAMYASLLLSLARKQYVKLIDYGNDTMIEVLQSNANQQVQTPRAPVYNSQSPYSQSSYGQSPYRQSPYVQAFPNRMNPYLINNQSQQVYGITNQVNQIVDGREPLTYCEQQYYNLLLRHVQRGRIRIADLEKRILADRVFASDFENKIKMANINNAGPQAYTNVRFYQEAKDKLKRFGKKQIKLGIALLTIGNLISILSSVGKPLFACFVIGIAGILLGVYALTQVKYCASLTNFGEQEYRKWRGLYNFLKSDTLLTERTHIELPLWEQYLVYATAFGISEKVVEAIRIRCITIPPETSIASTNSYRIGRIHTHSSSIRRSIHTSSRSYHMSSYGGGYNAGGRGIGGGGGGH